MIRSGKIDLSDFDQRSCEPRIYGYSVCFCLDKALRTDWWLNEQSDKAINQSFLNTSGWKRSPIYTWDFRLVYIIIGLQLHSNKISIILWWKGKWWLPWKNSTTPIFNEPFHYSDRTIHSTASTVGFSEWQCKKLFLVHIFNLQATKLHIVTSATKGWWLPPPLDFVLGSRYCVV